MAESSQSLYGYQPSHALPAVFATLVGLSLLLHIYQNFRYKFWKVTFFMFWAGTVFTVGWVVRTVASYRTSDLNLYIVQTVFVLAGPPIYSAAEYNVLGRLMHYVPMHAPLNPNRLVYFFIYVGAAVESLTAAGASLLATSGGPGNDQYHLGGKLISISLVLQGAVELLFMSMVARIHHRCVRANMLTRNVRNLCIMLYGTSILILFRCVFRAIESFSTTGATECNAICRTVTYHEWYLYVFEAAPMVVYTYWINLVHPGRLLPRQPNRYLDVDGKTEKFGPGWIDRRSTWETFVDPFDLAGTFKGKPNHDKFWLKPDEWVVAGDGSFADGSASNARRTKQVTEVTGNKFLGKS